MRATSLTFAILGVAAAGCFPLRETPLYCDETRPCDYPEFPERTYCDYDGTLHEEAVQRTCIEPPQGLCQRHDHCPATDPICNVANEMCRGCASNEECAARDSNTPHCDGSGQCVGVQLCSDSNACTAETEPICSAEGACVPCELDGAGDADCAAKDAGSPWCLASGACAVCRDNSHCGEAMPVCDAGTNTCRLCTAHTECGSEVCHLDGTSQGRCAPVDAVLYVAPNGSGTSCSQSSPCSVETAIEQIGGQKVIIRARAGTYTDAVDIPAGPSFTLVGDADAIFAANSGTEVIEVGGARAVTLDGVTVRPTTANQHGVHCTNQTAEVTVVRAVVEGVGGGGTGVGVRAPNCNRVAVRQSIIRNHGGGGVRVSDVDTELVNNFIVGNGTVGGVHITDTPPAHEYVIRFNTIADNTAGAGVNCLGVTTIALANNIVQGNAGAQVSANCLAVPPAISGCPADGNNTGVDPRFVGGGDYHIQPDSPCRNKATAGGVLVDIDGDPRPQGAGEADVGADEVVE